MNKLSLLLLGFIAFHQGYSQFLKVGVKGGANLVKMDGSSFKEAYNLGYYAGGFVEIKLAKNWYLQPEVLFSETDLTPSDEFKDVYEELLDLSKISTMKLQALNIPVTLNYRLSNVFVLSAGPQFSMLVNRGESFMKNARTAFTAGDVAIMAGANVTIKKIRIFGRYLWGISDKNDISDKDPWRSQTARLGVGFVL
jgi:hypothetical protein